MNERTHDAANTGQALAFLDKHGTLDGFKLSRALIVTLRSGLRSDGFITDRGRSGKLMLTSSGRQILKDFRAAGGL